MPDYVPEANCVTNPLNHELLFLYSLTVDDLLFLKSIGVELSKREELRLAIFLQEAREDIGILEALWTL
jgi:hypothetical protein